MQAQRHVFNRKRFLFTASWDKQESRIRGASELSEPTALALVLQRGSD
jgi:hypothetical protein